MGQCCNPFNAAEHEGVGGGLVGREPVAVRQLHPVPEAMLLGANTVNLPSSGRNALVNLRIRRWFASASRRSGSGVHHAIGWPKPEFTETAPALE